MQRLATTRWPRRESKASCYAQIAREYYDASRHPTCANFRAASSLYVSEALQSVRLEGTVVDVGAGRSLAAELLREKDRAFKKLVLVDGSIEMLEHSLQFVTDSVLPLLADACELPFYSESISLMIASLGDPYNQTTFWDEVARCLRPGGACIFTAPSYEWANSFRNSTDREQQGLAFFELLGNRAAYVPSIICSTSEQAFMIARSGLKLIDSATIGANSVPPPYSKKIPLQGGIVTGYTIIK